MYLHFIFIAVIVSLNVLVIYSNKNFLQQYVQLYGVKAP